MAQKYVYLPNNEVATSGLLQEINRLFLHRLGFALAVLSWEDGDTELRIIDQRLGNPGGIVFGDIGEDHRVRAKNVHDLMNAMEAARRSQYGFVIEPVFDDEKASAIIPSHSPQVSGRKKRKGLPAAEVNTG